MDQEQRMHCIRRLNRAVDEATAKIANHFNKLMGDAEADFREANGFKAKEAMSLRDMIDSRYFSYPTDTIATMVGQKLLEAAKVKEFIFDGYSMTHEIKGFSFTLGELLDESTLKCGISQLTDRLKHLQERRSVLSKRLKELLRPLREKSSAAKKDLEILHNELRDRLVLGAGDPASPAAARPEDGRAARGGLRDAEAPEGHHGQLVEERRLASSEEGCPGEPVGRTPGQPTLTP